MIKSIKKALYDYFYSTAIGKALMQAAPVLMLIYPVLAFISSVSDKFSYGDYYRFVYYIFLLGLVLGFAKDAKPWLALTFLVLSVSRFIDVIGSATFNLLVMLAVAVVALVFALRDFVGSESYYEILGKVKSVSVPHAPQTTGEVCANCGARVPEDASFCLKCGSPVTHVTPAAWTQAAKTCKNCGAPLIDDSAFCLKCGTPVAVAAPAAEQIPQPPAEPICHNCGAPLLAGAAFCLKCGMKQ